MAICRDWVLSSAESGPTARETSKEGDFLHEKSPNGIDNRHIRAKMEPASVLFTGASRPWRSIVPSLLIGDKWLTAYVVESGYLISGLFLANCREII